MQFDWDQLRPRQELTDAHKSLIREISETYLNTGVGVLVHEKRVSLGRDRRSLDDLARLGFIVNSTSRYYPAFPSLFYLNPDQRDYCAELTDRTLRAFQSLYEKQGPKKFALQQIQSEVNRVGSRAINEQEARVGMHFAQAFQKYVSNFEYSVDGAVVSAYASEDILDYDSLQQSWQEELGLRPRPQSDQASSTDSTNDSNAYGKDEYGTGKYGVSTSEEPVNGEESRDETKKDREHTKLTVDDSSDTTDVQVNEVSPQADESIQTSSTNDTPTDKDALGFKPYVEAISRFLLSADTKPPLTLSIEGEWGSGKSSFMMQLRNSLVPEVPSDSQVTDSTTPRKRRFTNIFKRSRHFSVWFNPWRHDTEESLWAAFALEFLRQVRRERFFLRRWWADVTLFFAHYNWRNGWFEMVRALMVWCFMVILAVGSVDVLLKKPLWAAELVMILTHRPEAISDEPRHPRYQQLSTANKSLSKEGQTNERVEKSSADLDPILKILRFSSDLAEMLRTSQRF